MQSSWDRTRAQSNYHFDPRQRDLGSDVIVELGHVEPTWLDDLDSIITNARPATWANRGYKGEGVEVPPADLAALADARGNILIVGFGRFGQLVTQVLLAQGCAVTVIDKNVDAVRNAARFGFKIYYGDGTRLDVLRAAGAASARVVVICIDDRAAALVITDLIQAEFPLAVLHARAYDRVHAIELMNRKVDVVIRETMLSAIALGRETLLALGIDEDTADAVVEDVKTRDHARLLTQQEAGMMAGREWLPTAPVPEPLSPPKSRARALTAETEEALASAQDQRP